MNAKRYWLSWLRSTLKEAEQRSNTVKQVTSGGNLWQNSIWVKFYQEMRYNDFVDGLEVLNKLVSLSFCFFTRRMGVLQRLVQSMRRLLYVRPSTIGLSPSFGFKGYWRSLSNGLVGSIWTLIGSALIVFPMPVKSLACRRSWSSVKIFIWGMHQIK